MVKSALSERIKSFKKLRANEHRLSLAAAAYQQAKQGYTSKKSLRDIAYDYNVNYRTLARRIKNEGPSILEFNAKKQKLTPAEEKVLVKFLLESAAIGFPLTHRQIERHANAILESKQGTNCEKVGKQWVFNFLTRHHTALSTHWSKPLDTQRAKSLNPAAVKSWFDLLEKWVVALGVRPEDIYGMDESGFPTAYAGKERVVGARGTKTQHKQGGANRENVTAIITICADGTTVKPMIIYKGKKMMQKWNDNNVSEAHIAYSENGWTDGKLGYLWLTTLFDPETKEKAGGRPRVLILDGHSSHYTAQFLEYAHENNIIVLGYPPHCTHALQGLDVVCFGKMKEAWKQVITQFEEEHKREVTKGDFTFLFGTAFNRAFDEKTVKAAFRVTGVYPFDPTVISAEQMKPSTTTSVKGEFPLPQPSPVRAIIAAFDPHGPAPVAPLTPVAGSGPISPETQHSPSSSRRRIRDENIDPALYTPSKRIRSLYSALSSTKSGSFLLSKDPISSSTPIFSPVLELPPSSIPQPNWDLANSPVKTWKSRETLMMENANLREALRHAHTNASARDLVIEGAHAQLVLQNLHLQKANQALNKQENKKKNDRALLFAGRAQVLTSQEFRAKVAEQNAAREAAAAEKAKKADARLAKKNAMALIEEEWARIKHDHEQAVKAWEIECQKLKDENVPKRSWPPKPRRARKPKLPTSFDVGEDEDDENDDDDVEDDD